MARKRLILDNLIQYEDFVDEMSIMEKYPIIYPALGLGGEAGEVVDQVKKMIRNDNAELTEERKLKIIDEMGDTLFYLTMLAHQMDVPLTGIMIANMEKLYKRRDEDNLRHG